MSKTEYIKKVGKTGNSMQVTLPKEAKEFGFELGSEVVLKLENNKIIIELQEKKEEYYSRMKGFYKDQNVYRPTWNDTNKSTRFEEIQHITKREVGGYDLKLYYDHKEDMYMAFICGNNQGSHWFGHYIIEEDFNKLSQETCNAWEILLCEY